MIPFCKPAAPVRSGAWSFLPALGLGVLLSAGLAGCDSDDDPQLTIVAPQAGATVELGADMTVPFTISANDFALRGPEVCDPQDNRCGQAYLNIDGNLCNQPGQAYNAMLGDGNLGQDFFITADFSLCPAAQQAGSHLVTIALRKADGTPILGEGGVPVTATASIVTTR